MTPSTRIPTSTYPSMAYPSIDWTRVPRFSAPVPIGKPYTLPPPHERRKAQVVYRRPHGESSGPIALPAPVASIQATAPSSPPPVHPFTSQVGDVELYSWAEWGDLSNEWKGKTNEDIAVATRAIAGNLTALYRNKYD